MIKKAALISYFNDIDMLKLQFKSGQLNPYEKIYIFDGPFSYTKAVDFMREPQPSLSETEFGKQVISMPNVIYRYEEWHDEREKRIESYRSIEGVDLIVLHDTDEFYSYKDGALEGFMDSAFSVAPFCCQNLFLTGVRASSAYYNVNNFSGMPHKNFIFKPTEISPEEHLNYLWLVGVDQAEPNKSLQSQPVAYGYHYTGMRSNKGQEQKYIFYTTLHSHARGGVDGPVISTIKKMLKSNEINPDLALDSYLHSNPGFSRCPDPEKKDLIIGGRIINDELESSLKGVLEGISWKINEKFSLIRNIKRYLFYPNDRTINSIVLSSASLFQCKLFSIREGESISLLSDHRDNLHNFKMFEDDFQVGFLFELSFFEADLNVIEVCFEVLK